MLTKKTKDFYPEQSSNPAPAEATASTSQQSQNPAKSPAASYEKRKGAATTRVIVKYDVGFGNALFIRGKGINLNWNKGILLRNTKKDEWVWETDAPFSACEFKVLLNDREFELGDNHPLTQGSAIQYAPKFPSVQSH
jgi:hypothetical protein